MGLAHNPKIVTDGLVLCLDAANLKSYPGSGTTWSDLSKNGNDGTLVNSPAYSSDNKGSLTFDGVNDYVNLGTDVSNGLIDITVSIWVYVSNTDQQRFITKYVYPNGFLCYYRNSDNKFGVDGRESSASYFSVKTSNTYLTDEWYNYVFVKSENNWKIYINSVLDADVNNGTGTQAFSNASRLEVGAHSGFNVYSESNVSNTLLYNRALTESEVQQNFAATRGRYGI